MSLGSAIAVSGGLSGLPSGFRMQERSSPSRPSRLGTRRRRPSRALLSQPATGAGRSAESRAYSLDTDKQLQTTRTKPGRKPANIRDWLNDQETEFSLYRRQIGLHGELLGSYHKLWQDHAAGGRAAEAVKWEKRWLRVYNCRNEWIGFRADCCKSQTQPIAVPIGCNDRLCPLCAWDRARIARKRIKTLFDRLTHPAMITLTVPNKASIRKHDFELFRQRVKSFLASRRGWVSGGVYSMETTYNRIEKTWHIHAHILADLAAPLPTKAEKITLADERMYAFTALKLRIEFDWLRLWTRRLGKATKAGGDREREWMGKARDDSKFAEWVRLGRENRVREWRMGGYQPIKGLSASEMRRRTEWNIENRRVVDLRPVTDRDGAAREVLKYITKVADFGDVPEAVEQFATAVRGARLIQTFGSWYGVKLDAPADERHPEEWGEFKCACGCNMWRRMGVFYRRDVEMDECGRWHLTQAHDWHSGGTVPRPTIRALDEREG